jgi:hypothetical protein
MNSNPIVRIGYCQPQPSAIEGKIRPASAPPMGTLVYLMENTPERLPANVMDESKRLLAVLPDPY